MFIQWEQLERDVHALSCGSCRINGMVYALLVVHRMLIEQAATAADNRPRTPDSGGDGPWFQNHPLYKPPAEGTFNRYGSEGLLNPACAP